MTKKRTIFGLTIVASTSVLALSIVHMKKEVLMNRNDDFNIIKSEKRDNGIYLKTRNDISKSGKEIFIDDNGKIYSNDYIE